MLFSSRDELSPPAVSGRRWPLSWWPASLDIHRTPGRSVATEALLVAGWIALAGNWPLWRAVRALPEMAGARGLLFVAALMLLVAALTALPLLLLAWRGLIRPVALVFLISAAAAAHFMGSYGVVIDPTMMRNVLQTNLRESRDLLSLPLLMNLVLIAGLPLWWLWRRPLQRAPLRRVALRNALTLVATIGLALVVLLLSFQSLSGEMRNHKSLRYLVNPLSSFWSLGVMAAQAQAVPAGPPQPAGLDARVVPAALPGAKPPLLLLVIGETARADHFSLNGYGPPTNPQLAQIADLVSFGKVQSCGTSTAASLPCMLSPFGREAYLNRKGDTEGLLDVLQRAGLAVLWLDNQSGCKGNCDRVPHATTTDPAPGRFVPPVSLCPDGECLDEALLHDLDARVAALDPQRRKRGTVVVLHQMGSHGPAYSARSPAAFKPFAPECKTNVLQDCTREALVNAFDNSIVYTDHVLARAVTWLQSHSSTHDAALLYVSDHGESLGENGLYLHGMPYAIAPAAQKHVPMLIWTAERTRQNLALDATCMTRQRNRELSHDNLFHTMLGLARVRSAEYQRELDALAACRNAG